MQGSVSRVVTGLVVLGVLGLGTFWFLQLRDEPAPSVPQQALVPPEKPAPAANSANLDPLPAPDPLRGVVRDAYGAPFGAGMRVRVGHVAGAGPETAVDAEGRFELRHDGALVLPLTMVASSATHHGRLDLGFDAGVAEGPVPQELDIVARPLVGRLVRLVDTKGEPVRWPAQAVTASVLATDPRLELLVPGEGPERARAEGEATRAVLAMLSAEPGEPVPSLAWKLELPGYAYTRAMVELAPLQTNGTALEQVVQLERTAPGFGSLDVRLPAGISGKVGPGAVSLSLEPGGRAAALVYRIDATEDTADSAGGRATLRDVPAGAYTARIGVRGGHFQPAAGVPGVAIEVLADAEALLELDGPAWSMVDAFVVLPDGALHEGNVHLELRPGSVVRGEERAAGSELRTFTAPPYRFGPLPPGTYTIFLRRLPGIIEKAPVHDPFAGIEDRELPSIEFELEPGTTARVQLAAPGE